MDSDEPRPIDWHRLLDRGMRTFTGRLKPSAALVQILIFPVLILLWTAVMLLIIALT
jgi:hypothetical protein